MTDAADKKKRKKKDGTSARGEPPDPFVGRTIGGCRIIERIGRGAMAVVYKSEQISLNRTVALKLLDEGAADEEGALGRFFREARSAARLVHPNVVQVFDVGVDQNIPHIIMEYVDGETLYDRIQREGKIRAMAVRRRVPMITTVTGARAAVQAIAALRAGAWSVAAVQDYAPQLARVAVGASVV